MAFVISLLAFIYSVAGAYYWFYKHDTSLAVVALIGAISLTIVGIQP